MPEKISAYAIRLFASLLAVALLSSCRQQEQAEFTCTDTLGCVTIAPEENIKIGVLQALSGAIAPLGLAQLRGLELAIDQRQGKILGHNIELQIEDTGCTSEGGANAALKIIADPQTTAIFGSTCSGAAATASQAMSDAGLIMVSGNNSAPFLTSIGGKAAPNWQPGYFRTASNEEHAGHAAADYAYHELGVRRAAALNDGDIYTRGLTGSFRKGFEKLGGTMVLYSAINKGDVEMQPILNAVADSGAQLLFFPLFQPEGNRILRQARKMKELEDVVLMSDGALIQESFLNDVGELAVGMYFIGPAKPKGPEVQQLARRYAEKYQEAPTVSYYISGYDAASVLFHAIEQSAQLGSDGSLHLGRQKLRDTLYSLSGFKGVTGTLTCSKFGDCAQPVFNVLRLDNPDLGLQGLENNILHTSNYIQEFETLSSTKGHEN